MLGSGAEDQHCQPVPPAIHGGVKHPFANGFETAQIMVFLEQFLDVALLLRIGHGHDFDFIEARRSGVGERRDGRFLTLHAAEGKKSAGVCPAKSALTRFYRPAVTFMHTRWETPLYALMQGLNSRPGAATEWGTDDHSLNTTSDQ